MIYSENNIELKYLDNLSKAKQALLELDFINTDGTDFHWLKGWVFEQTIRQYLKEELNNKTKIYDFHEHETLPERECVDLVVGRVAIEMKTVGLFHDELEHYAHLRTAIHDKGWDYLYLALNESHAPFKESTKKVFGDDKTFFLNEANAWRKFINKVVELNSYV